MFGTKKKEQKLKRFMVMCKSKRGAHYILSLNEIFLIH